MPNFSGMMRKLTASDIPAALELSTEAGWNQTMADWGTLIDLAPEGCLAIEVDGELAATTTLLPYGQRLAWIGMVLTRIRYRGRGFARRLMTEALALADQMQIETVKLDATDQGQPMYEKFGFRWEEGVERWWRAGNTEVTGAVANELKESDEGWRELDLQAFGANRTELLSKLACKDPPLWLGNSYLFRRAGRLTSYLGPCVCESSEAARTLMEIALQRGGASGWSWDLLPRNEAALALARSLEFAPTRHLARMFRGKELRPKETAIYAIAGFELG